MLFAEFLCNVKHKRLRVLTAMVLPTGCPLSVGLAAETCRTKSQSPHYSQGVVDGGGGGGGGGGLVKLVSNDRCITDGIMDTGILGHLKRESLKKGY